MGAPDVFRIDMDMDHPIKGILFDLGETLLEFGKVDAVAFFRLGCENAFEYLRTLDVPQVDFAPYHRKQYWSVRWEVVKSKLTGRDFNIMDLVERVGRTFGHHLSRDELVEVAWRWYEPLSEQARAEPGLSDILADLRQRGLTLGVVSNTFLPGEVIDRQLDKLGLLEHLPTRVYSSRTVVRKPRRRIFQIALDEAGLEPAETMFVGDSILNDVRGANRMGMVSVLKDPSGRRICWPAKPTHRIRGLVQLPKLLGRMSRTSD